MKHFAILLTVLFVGLKLTGAISWSWFLVLSPLLILVSIIILLIFVVGICALVSKKFE